MPKAQLVNDHIYSMIVNRSYLLDSRWKVKRRGGYKRRQQPSVRAGHKDAILFCPFASQAATSSQDETETPLGTGSKPRDHLSPFFSCPSEENQSPEL